MGAFINAERLEELLNSYASSSESAPRGLAAVPPTATPTHVVQQAIEAELSSRTHSPTSTRVVPTATPILIPSTTVPTPLPPPHLRHLEEKSYMLELINVEREKVGAAPVILGDNVVAQLHTESSLENCFSSHWGVDGLKPYMRYSLAGGYQSNGENGSGSDYCITESSRSPQGNRYRPIEDPRQEVRDAMERWMDSPGHRRNILDKWHKKVNIGLAWDRYNFAAVQHFEGDYVEYDQVPAIENGILIFSGTVKNGVAFENDRDLSVQIYFDPPPHPLTRGQVSRTYCYGNGQHVASLREPPSGDLLYFRHDVTSSTDVRLCPDPYDIPADAPPPRSRNEAQIFWQSAYDESQVREVQTISVSRVTAQHWTANGTGFSVRADLKDLLSKYGNGVYSLTIWGNIGSERMVVSKYSIFLTDLPISTTSPSTGGSPPPAESRPPSQRHIEVKQRMLNLINSERTQAGLNPLVLGDNIAAQLHAEASLKNCFSSQWGMDGLKPIMRYSLAGGYQSNSSFLLGSNYCLTASDGFSPKDRFEGWISKQGLDPHYRRVNIGLAWDEYNVKVVLQYEGEYVEYDKTPLIADGILSLSGIAKNGVVFEEDNELGVQIYYDPPPRPLTLGQIARISCSDSGHQIAALRAPLTGNRRYTGDEFTKTYRSCADPHHISPDAPAPRSSDEARQIWREARDASELRTSLSITVPWVTALKWTAKGREFSVKADLSGLLSQYVDGVYTLMLWGSISGEREVISQYSIFHGITPPDTYTPTETKGEE